MSGDTVVVGAFGQGNNAGNYQSGAAYVYVRNGTNWSQPVYLKASNAEAGDYFGVTVSVSGATRL